MINIKNKIMKGTQRKILVVDDESGLRRLVRFWLTRSGYIVEEAIDGLDALEILKSQNFDVVFTDIMMPRMDGIALSEEIERRYPDVYVIHCSAFADQLDKITGKGKPFLLKPYEKSKLLDLIELGLDHQI